jgi:hypothetical protein
MNKCTAMQDLLLRKIDNELTESESRDLDAHMEHCPSCAREYGLLRLPGRIAQVSIRPQPSPFFYQSLRARIESDLQNIPISQLLFELARRVVPSMAAVTLALLSVFAYLHMKNPQNDLYTAYEQAFMGGNLPLRMMITEQRDITDENILNAIANQRAWQNTDIKLK